jgi:hypothetical protein
MKKIILEQLTQPQGLKDPTLKTLYSVCSEQFKNFKPSTYSVDGQNEVEVLRKDKPGEGYIIITNDLKYQTYTTNNVKSNNGTINVCPAYRGKQEAPMSDDMTNRITELKTNDQSLKSLNDKGVKENMSSHKPVDLYTLDPTVFPEPNKYFLYREVGVGGVAANVTPQVKDWLAGNNLTLDEPLGKTKEDIDRWKTRQPLLDALDTVVGKEEWIPRIEGQMGKKKEEIKVYNITLPNLVGVKPLDKFNNLATKVTPNIIERQMCRSVVKSLSEMSQLYRKNPVIIQNINSTSLNKMANYAMNCDLKKYLSGIAGVGDEILRLKRDSSPFGLLKKFNTAQNQAVNESTDDYIKSELRRKLLMLSEDKKKSSISINEYKNYIKIIDEAFNTSGLGNNRINESDILSNVLSIGGGGIIGYFKEKLADSIINKFVPGGADTWLGGMISTTIGNIKVGDYLNGNIFKCEFLVPQLAKSIGENAVRQFADNKGLTGGFYDVLRNSLVELIDDIPFIEKVESGMSKALCPTLSKLGVSVKNIFGKLATDVKQEFT